MTSLCLTLILVAFLLSCPLTWALIGIGRRTGQLDIPDAPGGRKAHAAPIPNTGGIAIFLALSVPIALGLTLAWLVRDSSPIWAGTLAPLAQHLRGIREQTPMILAFLTGLLVFHVMGLIDDRKRLGPFSKLAVQLAVTAVLAGFFHVRIFEFLEHSQSLGPTLGFVAATILSVLWMVTITNAMNFLDNMDGLSSGVGIVCGVMYLAATLINGQWFVAALAALLVGALLGFLCFNFPPAKVFMGDGGSLVLGLTLAVISIRTTYLPPVLPDAPGKWYALLMPVLVLAVPLYDLTSVTIIRLLQGKSPFVGDQQHFSHRLVKKGLSKRTAVIVIWLCALATGLGGVMLSRLDAWQAALVATQCLAVIAVLALLERTRPAA